MKFLSSHIYLEELDVDNLIHKIGLKANTSLRQIFKIMFKVYSKAIRLYIYIYMLAIAGQTAGANWLNIFREPISIPGVTLAKKNPFSFLKRNFIFKIKIFIFINFFIFHGQRWPLQ